LPPEKRRAVELTVYPEATHAWEQKLPRSISFVDPRIRRSVRITPDAAVSAQARAATVAFFKTAFGS
jgi:dienelactone hydrolase